MLTKIDIDIDDVYNSLTHTYDILAEFDDCVILDYVYQNLIDIIRDKIKSESNEE